MTGLRGSGVLVTRPVHQAHELSLLIERAGGLPYLLPTINIRPSADTAALAAQIHDLPRIDIAIAISSNAANYGQDVLAELANRGMLLAAVGPATANAMKHLGYAPTLVPDQGYNSEALLADARLTDVAGKTIVVVRGSAGRELLEQALTQRGATVVPLEVYAREPAQPAAGQIGKIEARWASGGIQMVTIYSVAALTNLLALLSANGQRLLRETQLITVSDRIAKKALQFGIATPALIADHPSDQAVVDTLIECINQRQQG